MLTKDQLRRWVDYALENDTLLLFDAAYEAYIQDDDIPHSIYEIKGARKVAIEFRSYSKTAGFTGVRCGYTVIPKEVTAATLDNKNRVELNHLWSRKQSTKFNGTPAWRYMEAATRHTSGSRRRRTRRAESSSSRCSMPQVWYALPAKASDRAAKDT